MRDLPVVAGDAGRGVAGLPAVLCEGRGGARSVHGLERPGAHARDSLPALGEVGKVVVSEIGLVQWRWSCPRTVRLVCVAGGD